MNHFFDLDDLTGVYRGWLYKNHKVWDYQALTVSSVLGWLEGTYFCFCENLWFQHWQYWQLCVNGKNSNDSKSKTQWLRFRGYYAFKLCPLYLIIINCLTFSVVTPRNFSHQWNSRNREHHFQVLFQFVVSYLSLYMLCKKGIAFTQPLQSITETWHPVHLTTTMSFCHFFCIVMCEQ